MEATIPSDDIGRAYRRALTLRFPPWLPVANISLSRLNIMHNTAVSIIMKFSCQHQCRWGTSRDGRAAHV